jgi:hypothetical protein
MPDLYSDEDVQQILLRASKLKQNDYISRKQLLEIAEEVGVCAENLQIAEQEWLKQRSAMQQQAVVMSRRRLGFKLHLIPYIFVSVFLVLLNLSTTPRYFWSIYPILGWGLGVTIHGACVYRPNERKLTQQNKKLEL